MAQRDSELKYSTEICILMLNSHCVTPAAVIVKEFFMTLQMTIFRLFIYLFYYYYFFFYLINKKNREKVKLMED